MGRLQCVDAGWLTWREAMQQALYGPDGFFRRESPADHFRTSVHASDLFAEAIANLAEVIGARTIVDVGAGRGELLATLAGRLEGVELTGVELVTRPADLPGRVSWTVEMPEGLSDVLVVANEWLDNIPLDVVEIDGNGTARIVEVDATSGEERLGRPVDGAAACWLDQWWPLAGSRAGQRAEIGRTRDEAWAGVVGRVRSGLLVAADYSHDRSDRPPWGTLTAYRGGRTVRPVPDGSCDVTAHVALDSAAAAGERAGATATMLTSQRYALLALGVDPTLPPRHLAEADPPAYVQALVRTSQAAELLDSAGLGGFGWLVQAVGAGMPGVLTRSPRS